MDIEWLRSVCLKWPGTTEGVKWGNDLCFMVAEKMFCVAGLQQPLNVAFKVTDEEFEEMSGRDGIIPAPYMARNKWVLVEKMSALNKKEWQHYVRQSYELIRSKLPKKLQEKLSD